MVARINSNNTESLLKLESAKAKKIQDDLYNYRQSLIEKEKRNGDKSCKAIWLNSSTLINHRNAL